MSDIQEGEEVRVLAVGLSFGYNQEQPPGGWVGHITRITPKQVHIEYGDLPRNDIFDRRSQRIRYGAIPRKFRTLPQMAEDERHRAAMTVLRGQGITLARDRKYALEQIEALAEVAKSFTEQDREAQS